ncbi:LuxR family transcriptional regulator [Loktanella sp. DJP18]|uniref:LuxR family transcriptional regulator n=1 Tax=Loktanella sp. DJP18 TaxID=3409788 RepID=UPI003BB64609
MKIINLAKADTPGAKTYADVIDDMRVQMGLDHIACGTVVPDRPELFGYGTYPEAWLKIYGERNLFETDPVVIVAYQSASPFNWLRIRDRPEFAAFFALAFENGIPRNGLSIPVRGAGNSFSVFTVSKHCTDSEWARHISPQIGTLMFLASQMHDNIVCQINGLPSAYETLPPKLSDREIEVLNLVEGGKSIEDLSVTLAVTPKTIEMMIRSARIKLDALTLDHAIARAKDIGLLAA